MQSFQPSLHEKTQTYNDFERRKIIFLSKNSLHRNRDFNQVMNTERTTSEIELELYAISGSI